MNKNIRDYEEPSNELDSSQQDIREVTSTIRAMARYGINGLGSTDPAGDRHEGQLLSDFLAETKKA